ncbi:MAG: helix-turn-helix domain-containing protein [Paludibacter sp.]|jgi:ribose 1,5-bisphosphokinase PhnN
MNLNLLLNNPELASSIRIETTVQDLLMFADTLINRSKKDATEAAQKVKTEHYMTQDEVCVMLGVCLATLWHWKKKNYLVPSKIGGKVRYKLSDVTKILNDK